ncbi:Efflux ABC transporter, ATP-binding protein [hydrothermal vent metagenome]|uniref:Efflux ABC transporter, ATP-binding protein n=1 Tax=hydrothermal vent metagenome TaxID=652676 RepID=A0A3B0VRY4_9ZZZZ
MIEIKQLSKSFADITAVDDVSFTAKGGEIFGLLGPNGAGKSTIINCISGLIPVTAGSITINSFNIASDGTRAKQSLGLVPQELALYEDLSSHENLIFWGSAYGMSGASLEQRIQQILTSVGLESRQKEPVKQFSGGMKRRLNFACAILHKPAALLLDEPTVGVDPQSREHLLQAIIELKQAGTAVIYTTHYMEEAEKLCDNLAIIDQGKIIASGTVDDLRAQVGERDLITLKGSFNQLKDKTFIENLNAEILELSELEIRLLIADASKHLTELLNTVETKHGKVDQVAIQQANLESLFIKLTGRALRDVA